MSLKIQLLYFVFFGVFASCIKEPTFIPEQEIDQAEVSLTIPVNTLTEQQLVVQAYVKDRPIIAHRGTTEYAPENTAAAYRFARYVGADYIQIDLQMTKDGYLVAFRNDLNNHSNISELFPGYENAPVNFFTLSELKSLDVGSSYNNLTYDRAGYEGLKILTLEEIINICEGKLEDGTPDPADLGNRPGIYIRFYDPWLNTGIEISLKAELTRLGWYDDDNLDNLREIQTYPNKVSVANTKGRVFLATQQKLSLLKLDEVFQGKIPLSYWLWYGGSHMPSDDAETYAEYINFGIVHGAQFIAPNISTYDLLQPWQSNLIRRSQAKIQAYTVDTKAKMGQYTYNDLSTSQGNIYQLEYDLTDGFITNRTQYAKYFYGEYYLGDPIVPNPPFYNTTAIKNVFITLGY